ncbi:unnamed protein product [Allacma fusca]|uniref:Acyl-CoA dehydrogenase n=1 Tax=Allacma fusca TaxID=39272 RepID=A0A8J2NWG3_9HEXA|nr:unnamed protein product [Allacma fusca]
MSFVKISNEILSLNKNSLRTFRLQNILSRNNSYSSTLPDKFYNNEQLEMQRSLKKIIDTDINPFVDEWEAKEQLPTHELFKKLGSAGFLGVNKPIEFGGLGLDYKYHAAVLEEMGTIRCGGVPMAIGVQTDVATPALARFGSDRLKKEFLQPAVQGDAVSCVGVTEPGAGSDVAGIKTRAIKDGDDLVITGEKMWISNGMQADWICLLANTSEGKPHKNKSLICVPMDSKGITRTKLKKLGNHCSDTALIHFDSVRVPYDNIIGDEGSGFLYQMLQFQEERLCLCLLLIKSMDLIISQTIDYTRNRKAFGKSILDNQVVQFKLAELATEVEALRALTYSAVDLHIQGENVTLLASMAKLKAGRLVRQTSDTCLQFWGGMGYSAETDISRYFRDTRLLSIGAGADEIMLQIIAKIAGISA